MRFVSEDPDAGRSPSRPFVLVVAAAIVAAAIVAAATVVIVVIITIIIIDRTQETVLLTGARYHIEVAESRSGADRFRATGMNFGLLAAHINFIGVCT